MPCSTCLESEEYQKHVKNISDNLKRVKHLGKSETITGIFEDEKGNEIAVNHKGNVVDNYYKGDPSGYKRAGKKNIASKDSHGKETGY